MPSLESPSDRLAAATAAADHALTNATAVELFTHLHNRTVIVKTLDDMVASEAISREKRDVLAGLLEENTATEIICNRERMRKAKLAIDALFWCALECIEEARKFSKPNNDQQ